MESAECVGVCECVRGHKGRHSRMELHADDPFMVASVCESGGPSLLLTRRDPISRVHSCICVQSVCVCMCKVCVYCCKLIEIAFAALVISLG